MQTFWSRGCFPAMMKVRNIYINFIFMCASALLFAIQFQSVGCYWSSPHTAGKHAMTLESSVADIHPKAPVSRLRSSVLIKLGTTTPILRQSCVPSVGQPQRNDQAGRDMMLGKVIPAPRTGPTSDKSGQLTSQGKWQTASKAWAIQVVLFYTDCYIWLLHIK